jgi:hypothetical protein
VAVAAEPFTFNKLFGVYTVPYEFAFHGKEREFRSIMESQFRDYGEIVRAVGIERLKEIIGELNAFLIGLFSWTLLMRRESVTQRTLTSKRGLLNSMYSRINHKLKPA